MFHTQKNRPAQAGTLSGASSEVCETQQRVPATFEVRDHALNDNTVVIELTVDLPVLMLPPYLGCSFTQATRRLYLQV